MPAARGESYDAIQAGGSMTTKDEALQMALDALKLGAAIRAMGNK